ncbi:uncharacterized protein LOC6733117 isoform X2 [Drosophila simulans]|uniref:GD21620 n=1 Tax=Drosophila simulans TaxID=7240 RepID=B4Q4V7_DROSI|nr:uncharacterized protein LOC6733117 isoform X2 [Drosophila simulans]EDX05779.1 GD21620 [Drosophila simulans]KMY91415.1 uncharacterized protein Dsimw501_GD21620, isoform A [Drosophila simulans]
MEYGNGMQYDGYSQGGEGFEMLYNQTSSGQGYSQQQSDCGQGSSNFNGGSASLGGPGYRSPLRYTKMLREMNSRNGLYSGAVGKATTIIHCPALAAQKVKLTIRGAMVIHTTKVNPCTS